MRVCILGGGGNVAEAISANLVANGHSVLQFRFHDQIVVPGTPQRPVRSKERLNETKFINASGQECELVEHKSNWITPDQFHEVDIFILAFPSYMAEEVAIRLGDKLGGKPLVNLSDRFLGTYALLNKIKHLYGEQSLPSMAVTFNGVPIMAIKASRDAPTTIYYIKPRHSIAWYPNANKQEAFILLFKLFGFKENELVPYDSMLHLGFENAHCIEHAVVDLYNLKKGMYQEGKFLYSSELYNSEVINKIDTVIAERDAIAEKITGRSFASLKDYDLRVFGKNSNADEKKAGTSDFRVTHTSLSKAPSPQQWGAFGYEDVGWSMVTLESFAKLFNISTPNLSSLIDEWCAYMNCDYRKIGRTVLSLNLISDTIDVAKVNEYRQLNWLPNTHADKRVDPSLKSNTTNKPLLIMKNQMKLVFSKTDEIDKRVYDSLQLLEPRIILEIYEEFKKIVPPIFGDNLIFGFVFGGFAKGYAVKDQDADFFICLKEENQEQITRFREWYFDLHQRYDLAPDVEFPGSITTLSHLKEKIEFAKTMKIRSVIETSYEKQAIVWTDIFSDTKGAKIGDLKELNSVETMCEGISQKWRIDLIKMKNGEINNELAKLPLTRLFRKFVTYLKQGDRLIPPPELSNLKAKL